jgi:hypothetical protein
METSDQAAVPPAAAAAMQQEEEESMAGNRAVDDDGGTASSSMQQEQQESGHGRSLPFMLHVGGALILTWIASAFSINSIFVVVISFIYLYQVLPFSSPSSASSSPSLLILPNLSLSLSLSLSTHTIQLPAPFTLFSLSPPTHNPCCFGHHFPCKTPTVVHDQNPCSFKYLSLSLSLAMIFWFPNNKDFDIVVHKSWRASCKKA